MIHALALILACQLAGEVLSRSIALPVPGPVLGMALLLVLMLLSQRMANYLRPTAEAILRHLSLLFVPAGVGVIGHLRLLGEQALAIGVVLVVSTVLAIAAGAISFLAVARLTNTQEQQDD